MHKTQLSIVIDCYSDNSYTDMVNYLEALARQLRDKRPADGYVFLHDWAPDIKASATVAASLHRDSSDA